MSRRKPGKEDGVNNNLLPEGKKQLLDLLN